MRGEQDINDLAARISKGSPPLARGTAIEYWELFNSERITPACAGNRKVIDNLPRVR